MKNLNNPRCFLRISLIAAIALTTLSTPIFAQEKSCNAQTQPDNQEKTITAETKEKSAVIEEEKSAETNRAVADDKTVEPTLARNFTKLAPLETPKFRDFSAAVKPQNVEREARQTSGDDDTMMGVMGKGTDSIKLGGHVGFVVPIVGRGNGVTTNVGDRFVFGFPVGLTLKTKKNIAIDFEFIPTFNTGRDFVLTIHPGIIYGFAKKYAVGVRAAYDAGNASYGFTPLISRGFKINEKVGFFIEADFPVRSNYNPYRDRFGSIAFAAHAGFAF